MVLGNVGREGQAKGTVVIFIVFLLFGTLVTVNQARTLKRYSQSIRWKATPGTITTLAISTNRPKHRGKSSSSARKSCRIQYNYTVDGEHYQGNRFDAQMERATHKKCMKLLNLTGPGEVVVYYNPNNPSESIITLYFSLPLFTLFSVVALMFTTIGKWLHK